MDTNKEDQPKTVFRTHRGLHQFKRIPFGLKTGPSVFQRLTDMMLGRYKWQIALVYVNNIIVYSDNVDEHLQDIQKMLQLVTKSGITLLPKSRHVGYQNT